MELQKIHTPTYTLKLTAEEISSLWLICKEAYHNDVKGAYKFYYFLEDKRPSGGFSQ